MSPAASTSRRPDWLVAQLPVGMLDDDFFFRFVAMFQEEAATLLDQADNLPNLVDLSVAPLAMVRWLATWTGMIALELADPAKLTELQAREAVRAWGDSLAWRGTRRGLETLLKVVTGDPGEIDDCGAIVREGDFDTDGAERVSLVRVHVPSTGWVSDAGLVTLVADQIPANVSFELYVAGRLVWPAANGVDAGGPGGEPDHPVGPGAGADDTTIDGEEPS